MKRFFLVSGISVFIFLLVIETVESLYIPHVIFSCALIGLFSVIFRLFCSFSEVSEHHDMNVLKRLAEISSVAFLFAAFCGTVYYGKLIRFHEVSDKYADKNVTCTLQILSEAEFSQNGWCVFEAKPVSGIETNGFRVKIFTDSMPEGDVYDFITGDFSFSELSSEYYLVNRSENIVLTGFAENIAVTECEDKPIGYLTVKLRRYVENALSRYFGEASSFVKAVLLGDRSDMDGSDFTSLRKSGLLHITAVSGLHIGIAASFMLSLLFFVKSRTVKYALIVPLLFVIAAVTGFSPSVIRSVFMTTSMYISSICLRRTDSFNILGAVLTLYLCFSPFSVYSASLLLSFASCLGIILFASRIRIFLTTFYFGISGKYLGNFGKNIISTFATSFAGTVFTIPASVFLFNSFTVAGIFTNILCLWLIKYIFIGAFTVSCLAWIPVLEPLFGVISLFVNCGVSYVMNISDMFSETVFSNLTAEPVTIIAAVAVGYLVYIVFGIKRKKFKTGMNKQVVRISVSVIASILVIVSVSIASVFNIPHDNLLYVVFADVGQGSASYVSYNGSAVVFDCGGSKNAGEILNKSLHEHRISNVECIVVSHCHDDHMNGLSDILAEWDVKNVVVSYTDNGSENFIKLKSLVSERETELTILSDDSFLTLGEIYIRLWTEHFDLSAEDQNENCIVSMVEFGNIAILFPGDSTAESERRLIDSYELELDASVLAVSHHASKYSSCEEFLGVVDPDIMVVSVGKNNYGEPDGDVLSRLVSYGDVYSTMISGNIELVSDGETITLVE